MSHVFLCKIIWLKSKNNSLKRCGYSSHSRVPSFQSAKLLELIKKRRSIYSIGKNLQHTPSEIEGLIQKSGQT